MADRLTFLADLCFLSCDLGRNLEGLEGILLFTDGRETTSICLRSTLSAAARGTGAFDDDKSPCSFSLYFDDFCSLDFLLVLFFCSFLDFRAEESSEEQRDAEAVPLLCMVLEISIDSLSATETFDFLLFRLTILAGFEEEAAEAKNEGRFEADLGLGGSAIA